MVAQEVNNLHESGALVVDMLLRMLVKLGVAESFRDISATLICAFLAIGLCIGVYYLLTKVVSPVITKIVTLTDIKWDDILFNPMMLRAWSELVTSIVILLTVPPSLSLYSLAQTIALLCSKIAIVMAAVHLVNRFIMAVYDLMTEKPLCVRVRSRDCARCFRY